MYDVEDTINQDAERENVIIMGAAGRDFHDFNVKFRDDAHYNVVAFTATQIPDIDGRTYPAQLSGELYPDGVPIYDEAELPRLIKEHNVKTVLLSYSDLLHEDVMHKASIVLAAGANFQLLGTDDIMLESSKPVIAVNAVRTGCGKSQTTRAIADALIERGYNVVAVRHPMPYGDLVKQECQRFETYDDLNIHECTIEEREEYEPYIDRGMVVYAGVDYGKILAEAEKEADIILWDGGNNDVSFYRPDLQITLVDPHRPGHELAYHPGEVNLRTADVILIGKEATADYKDIETVRRNAREANPDATIVDAASVITVEDVSLVEGKRVLVVEDGPTCTHGGMGYGAGFIAAEKFGATELVDGRDSAAGSLKDVYEKFTHLEKVLPAMGYSSEQVKDLEKTINDSDAEVVVMGTPIDLNRIMTINKPTVRVHYELATIGQPDLDDVLDRFEREVVNNQE